MYSKVPNCCARPLLYMGVGVALVVGVAAQSQAMTILVDYTGSVAPDFSFGPENATVTPTEEGVRGTVPAGPDTFAGFGQDSTILASPVINLGDSMTVRAKLGSGENTTDFVFAFREASNEFFSYSVPASAFNTSTFEDYTITDLSAFFFNGDFSDGIPNDAVIEVSVQTPFGGTGAGDIIVESISTSAIIPEPASLALMGIASLAVASMRRRKYLQ